MRAASSNSLGLNAQLPFGPIDQMPDDSKSAAINTRFGTAINADSTLAANRRLPLYAGPERLRTQPVVVLVDMWENFRDGGRKYHPL